MSWFFIESKGRNNEFYQLKVIDITDQGVQHALPDGSIGTMPHSECFLFHRSDTDASSFSIGDDVEIFICEKESWWPGKIVKLKNEFAVCSVGTSQEVVEINQLRPCGHSQSLALFKLFRCDIADGIADDNELDLFITDLLPRLTGPYLPLSMAQPPCVLSLCEQDVKRAWLISNALYRKLQQKVQLMRSISEMEQRLATSGSVADSSHVIESFTIERHLIGLAIGGRGANVKRARRLKGILRIDFDDSSCTFTIIGESQEACNAAKDLLLMEEATVLVPEFAVGQLIGRNGHNIQQLVEKTNAFRIDVGTVESGNELVPIHILGSKLAVADAAYMIEYFIEGLQSESTETDEANSG